jgi:hypothetical protein
MQSRSLVAHAMYLTVLLTRLMPNDFCNCTTRRADAPIERPIPAMPAARRMFVR